MEEKLPASLVPHKEKEKVKEDYKKGGMLKREKNLAELSLFGIQVNDGQDSANGRRFPSSPAPLHSGVSVGFF